MKISFTMVFSVQYKYGRPQNSSRGLNFAMGFLAHLTFHFSDVVSWFASKVTEKCLQALLITGHVREKFLNTSANTFAIS